MYHEIRPFKKVIIGKIKCSAMKGKQGRKKLKKLLNGDLKVT